MGLRLILVGMACCLAAPLAAATKDREPEVLARSGKWIVNYDRDSCHLVGQFGTGDAAVAMRITNSGPGDWFQLAIYGDRVRSDTPRSDAKVQFAGAGEPTEVKIINGKSGKVALAMIRSIRIDGWQREDEAQVPPRITPEQEAAVTGVTISIRDKRPFRLEFGPLSKPFIEMRKCLTDLIRSWGYDPVEQAALLRPVSPINSPGSWLNADDYPVGALRQGQNGLVQFRLDVDAKGAIEGCHVIARTNPDVFADVTCRAVVKRAKLQPALDARGKPVRSFLVQQVGWQIEI